MHSLVQRMSRSEFFRFTANEPAEFLKRIDSGHAFIVSPYLDPYALREVISVIGRLKRTTPAGWHPCVDACPDHHRINDEYPGSYVRGRLRAYHFHRWNQNRQIFDYFRDIFDLKHALAGVPAGSYWDTIPSDLVIARVTVNHYPAGGGYLHEHIDPAMQFARIQTVVLASAIGADYERGGLYYRPPGSTETVMVDSMMAAGDLAVLSPAVRHGVTAIDPGQPLDWESDSGRWSIVPIIMHSDHVQDRRLRSKMSGDDARRDE